MKIYIKDQSSHFVKYLQLLKNSSVVAYEQGLLKEKKSVTILQSSKLLKELNTDFFFNYQIFPSHIMKHACEWKIQQRDMQVGDTIVQQVQLPPILGFAPKIIFGVRICRIIKETDFLSFSYETLEGHVEKGVSTFSLIQLPQNAIEIQIHTFSKPGNIASKLLGPVFSVPYQSYCTKQALKNIYTQLEQ